MHISCANILSLERYSKDTRRNKRDCFIRGLFHCMSDVPSNDKMLLQMLKRKLIFFLRNESKGRRENCISKFQTFSKKESST